MADYTDSKPVLGDVFPVNAVESTWQRTEPLITPEQLRRKHLWGLQLISQMPDPRTGRAMEMTDDDIGSFIDSAVGLAEAETGLIIFPTKFKEGHAWDRQEYDSFGYFKVRKRPVYSIDRITVTLSNGDAIYEVPKDWIEVANAQWGQINIVPLTIALTSGNPVAIPTTAGGALLLSIFQGKSQWVCKLWQVDYTCGFPNAMLPKVVNDYIGTIAAMEILSQLASTYGRNTGSSLSLDGGSQSVSTPGPEIFKPRLEDLAAKREMLVNKLKNMYGLKYISNNV